MDKPAKDVSSRPCLGWREYVSLPELGVSRIKVKVDTGARTSALHAYDIELLGRGWVRFSICPRQKDSQYRIPAKARLKEQRRVRSSTGHETERPVIVTVLRIGEHEFPIELTLVNRDPMGFRMLLGRSAIKGRFLINPGRSFLASKGPAKKKKKTKKIAKSPHS